MTFRYLGAVATAAILAMAATPVIADDDDWTGLYQGLDAFDGSVDYLSIVPSSNGKFDIRVVPSVISLCESKVGWILAEGRLVDDETLARENVKVHCSGAEPKSVPDGVYRRDDQTGILTIETPDDKRTNYYHKISND
jgi:hypothetical protein